MGDYLMSTIKANDIQNASGGIPTVKGQKLIPTAWVNFNGSSTVAIRDSEGVSSISDGGTGRYTVNFTANLSNANYSAVASHTVASSFTNVSNNVTSLTVGSFIIQHRENGAVTDTERLLAVVMGGQA